MSESPMINDALEDNHKTIFFTPVKAFLSINETAQKSLNRLGIKNLRDLVFYKPVSYNQIDIGPDLRTVKHGDLIQVTAKLEDLLRPVSRKSPLKIYVTNDTGSITLVFFNKIHPYIYNQLRLGEKYTISGKLDVFDHELQITHPEFIFKKNITEPILPVYKLTYGIVNKQLYGYIREGIALLEKNLTKNDYFSEFLAEIKNLHYVFDTHNFNDNEIITRHNNVVEKLAARELFANQASLAQIRSIEHRPRGRSFECIRSIDIDSSSLFVTDDEILSKFGFELTPGQIKAINEIRNDQISPFQMMRLLQGDVGSGKTIVALLTMLKVIQSGAQAALMVPTDLLSHQHYQSFCDLFEGTKIQVGLLTGKTTIKDRRIIKNRLLNGEINILIGTHALFQEHVEFKDLGYIVIDEQHKFGVEQRLELIKKASSPDVLIMTATPIPRSLTLTMFGDMDVSLLKSKPRNRLPIITTIISVDRKLNLITSLAKKIESGEQVYWVCPLVDDNTRVDLDSPVDDSYKPSNNQINSNVTSRHLEIESIYPNQVSMIHGQMKGDLKDQIMQNFKNGKTKILVATTVIEVGIDVPESTLIIIENAEQFGLAQLHQLRGRVGRGVKQSHCILMYNPRKLSKIAIERLKIMRESDDGFYIAEQDLILRGGGEILGTKQSGEPSFFFADLSRDLKILLEANRLVKNIQDDELIDFQIKLFEKNKRELIKSG